MTEPLLAPRPRDYTGDAEGALLAALFLSTHRFVLQAVYAGRNGKVTRASARCACGWTGGTYRGERGARDHHASHIDALVAEARLRDPR